MKFNNIINTVLARFGLIALSRKQYMQQSEQLVELQSKKDLAPTNTVDFNTLLQHQIYLKWNILDSIEKGIKLEESVTCPICEFNGPTDAFFMLESSCIFEGGRLIRHQCPSCDVIFGPNKMFKLTDVELAEEYKWHYRAFSEGDSTLLEKRAFHALYPDKKGLYLNWGAGSWSQTIDDLRNEGWNVFGFEPHAQMPSASPFIITDKKQLTEMRFDGIFSNNVLEHFRYPVNELSAMRKMLKEGGKMSHATPCYEYLYEYTRFHLFFFLGRSRELLAEKALLNIQDFSVDGDFMNIVFTKK